VYTKLFSVSMATVSNKCILEGFFCTDMKSDGSFVPVVPSKTIPVQCFQTCKAWLHSTVLFPSSYWLHVNLSHNAMPKGGKIGRKQSVLKKNCQKKKSKFKGVQEQKKVPMELARNAATVWWPRTAIKNIQISRNWFRYIFFNFDLFLIFLFKIKASESKIEIKWNQR